MSNYIGLDVSLKTTSICIMDKDEKILVEKVVNTNPKDIAEAILVTRLPIKLIGIESGGTSHWLTKELKKLELPAVCICSKKMAAAI